MEACLTNEEIPMGDNPYRVFCNMFRNPDPADGWQFCEGVVRSLQPVSVEAFGLIFSGGNLRINSQLLAGWSQEVTLELSQNSLHGVQTVTAGCLHAGDRVLCLAGQDALYVILRMVSG